MSRVKESMNLNYFKKQQKYCFFCRNYYKKIVHISMDKYLDTIFDKVDPSIKLDKQQREVVLDNSDNIIVIAVV